MNREAVHARLRLLSLAELAIVLELSGLKMRGETMRGPCPLHGGKGDNFVLYSTDHGPMWTCHSRCGTGDALSLVGRLHGLDPVADFFRLVHVTADLLGVTVSEDHSWTEPLTPQRLERVEAERREREKKSGWLDAHRSLVLGSFMARCPLSGDAMSYLKHHRKCWLPTTQFKPASDLGFGSYNPLAFDAVEAEHGPALTKEHLGAGSDKSLDRSCGDFRAHSLLFPVTNVAGEVVAVQGRSTEPDCPKARRYTSRGVAKLGLFGGKDLASNPSSLVVLCEGALDTLTLRVYERELTDAWGPFTAVGRAGAGGGLSEAQAAALSGRRVMIAYDGDQAGVRGAEAAARALHKASAKSVQLLHLPEGVDLNALALRGAA